jgi:hypothetical protein
MSEYGSAAYALINQLPICGSCGTPFLQLQNPTLHPCHHFVLCFPCARTLLQTQGKVECATCRTSVSQPAPDQNLEQFIQSFISLYQYESNPQYFYQEVFNLNEQLKQYLSFIETPPTIPKQLTPSELIPDVPEVLETPPLKDVSELPIRSIESEHEDCLYCGKVLPDGEFRCVCLRVNFSRYQKAHGSPSFDHIREVIYQALHPKGKDEQVQPKPELVGSAPGLVPSVEPQKSHEPITVVDILGIEPKSRSRFTQEKGLDLRQPDQELPKRSVTST